MKNIIIVCIQGVTSTVLARKLNEYAKKEESDYHFKSVSVSKIADYLEDANYILLTPQVKGKVKEIETLTSDYSCELKILLDHEVSFTMIEQTFNNIKSIIETEKTNNDSFIKVIKKILIDICSAAVLITSFGLGFELLYLTTQIPWFHELYQLSTGIICLYLSFLIGLFYAKHKDKSQFIYGSVTLLTTLLYSPTFFNPSDYTITYNFHITEVNLIIDFYSFKGLMYYIPLCLLSAITYGYIDDVISKFYKNRHYLINGYFNLPTQLTMFLYLFFNLIVLFLVTTH